MTTSDSTNPPGKDSPTDRQSTWHFQGTPEAMEALCRREQAQAEAVAEAMKVLRQPPGASRRERDLLKQVRTLQRALRRRRSHRPPQPRRRGRNGRQD